MAPDGIRRNRVFFDGIGVFQDGIERFAIAIPLATPQKIWADSFASAELVVGSGVKLRRNWRRNAFIRPLRPPCLARLLDVAHTFPSALAIPFASRWLFRSAHRYLRPTAPKSGASGTPTGPRILRIRQGLTLRQDREAVLTGHTAPATPSGSIRAGRDFACRLPLGLASLPRQAGTCGTPAKRLNIKFSKNQ